MLWDDAERAGFGEEANSSGPVTQRPNQTSSFSIASRPRGSRRPWGWRMMLSSPSRPVPLRHAAAPSASAGVRPGLDADELADQLASRATGSPSEYQRR